MIYYYLMPSLTLKSGQFDPSPFDVQKPAPLLTRSNQLALLLIAVAIDKTANNILALETELIGCQNASRIKFDTMI